MVAKAIGIYHRTPHFHSSHIRSIIEGFKSDEPVYYSRYNNLELAVSKASDVFSDSKRGVIVIISGIFDISSCPTDINLKIDIDKVKPAELLAHCYELLGKEVFVDIQGSYSAMIFDIYNKQLLFYRDPLGIYPLYWYQDESQFVFSTDIKTILMLPALPKSIDKECFLDYLTFGFFPLDTTPVTGLNRLLPGTVLTLQMSDFSCRIKKAIPLSNQNLEQSDITTLIEDRLQGLDQSISYTAIMNADPLSMLGMDLVKDRISHAEPTKLIGFDQGSITSLSSKIQQISQASLDTEFLDVEEFLRILPIILWDVDEPFADYQLYLRLIQLQKIDISTSMALNFQGLSLAQPHQARLLKSLNLKQRAKSAFLKYLIHPVASRFSSATNLRLMRLLSQSQLDNDQVFEAFIPFQQKISECSPDFYKKVDLTVVAHKFKSTYSWLPSNMHPYLYQRFFGQIVRFASFHRYEMSLGKTSRAMFMNPNRLSQVIKLSQFPDTVFFSDPIINQEFSKELNYLKGAYRVHHRQDLYFLATNPIFKSMIKQLRQSIVVEMGLVNQDWIDQCLKSDSSMYANLYTLFGIWVFDMWIYNYFFQVCSKS